MVEKRDSFRPAGPLESLFQEMVRRATAAGLSGFFTTEEAMRRAFSDSAPPELVEYFSRQTLEVREELFSRLSEQFGEWLRTLDPTETIHAVLQEYDLSATVHLRFERKGEDGATKLEVVPPRK